MKKEGVIILTSILLFSMLAVTADAVCLENQNRPSCRTRPAIEATAGERVRSGTVCAFENNLFSCKEPSDQLNYCCELRSDNGGISDGFVVSEQNLKPARDRMQRGANQLLCYPATTPGTIQDDGSCRPGNPRFVDTRQRGFIGGAPGQQLFCGPGKVVCSISSDRTMLETPFLSNAFGCCSLGDGITIDETEKPVPFPNIQLGRGLVAAQDQLVSCEQGSVLCGFEFGQQELKNDLPPNFLNPPETIVKTLYCCKINNVRVKAPSFEILPEYREENTMCFPNEVLCGANAVRARILGGVIDYYKTPMCCELEKCEERPECAKPDGDADCNNVLDRNEAVCVIEAQRQRAEGLVEQARQEADLTPETCTARGLGSLGTDVPTGCCGDDGAEFFVADKKACLDQQVVSSPGIGGGRGLETVIYKKEGPLEVTAERKTTDGETRGEDNKMISLRDRNGLSRADNEYLIEFDATIDGREDPSTTLTLEIYDKRGLEIMHATYPSFGAFKVSHSQRHLRAPIFTGDGHAEIKIVARKSGTGTVSIRNLVVYHKQTKKILFNENKFIMCAAPDNGEENEAVESLRITHPASAPLITDKRNACQQEADFYCDTDGLWKTTPENRNELVLKQIPSERQRNELNLDEKLFTREPVNSIYEKHASACCASDQCWTGEQCIGGYTFGSSFMSPDGKKALFCRKGAWEVGSFKQNQHENDGRVCPEKFCAYKTAQGHDCRPDAFFGPAVDGAEGEDIFCDSGTWTSRPAKIARALFLLPDVGSRFSIYCDTPEDVLVNKDYAPALPAETSAFMKNGGANYACVLEYNTHAWKDAIFKGLLSEVFVRNQNVIVALALKNADAITNVDAGLLQSLDPAFGATDMVDGVTQLTYCMAPKKYFDDPLIIGLGGGREEFIGCTGVWNAERAAQHRYDQGMIVDRGEANLWYNQRLNTVLYSPKAFRVK